MAMSNWYPDKKMSPAAELACVCLAAASIPFVLVGYGVWKVGQFICDLGRGWR